MRYIYTILMGLLALTAAWIAGAVWPRQFQSVGMRGE